MNRIRIACFLEIFFSLPGVQVWLIFIFCFPFSPFTSPPIFVVRSEFPTKTLIKRDHKIRELYIKLSRELLFWIWWIMSNWFPVSGCLSFVSASLCLHSSYFLRWSIFAFQESWILGLVLVLGVYQCSHESGSCM